MSTPKNSQRSLFFSKKSLLSLQNPEEGKRSTYYDSDVSKLALRVTHAGSKTFYVVKRAGNEMVWLKLGTFPDMTVEQARNAALVALSSFATNENPAEIRRAKKAELTFGEFFKEYSERYGQQKKSWASMQSNYKHLESLANRKLSAITREMIARILSDLTKAGRADGTITNVRAFISGIYSKAIEWGYASANPVVGIKTNPKVKRDRFLQADELPRFFQSLAEESNIAMRDFILLALLTGARRANLMAMRWQEVNLDEGVWRIPVTKNGTPQNVTLSPEALLILQQRKKEADKQAVFVFPADSESGHITEPKDAVARVMRRAGIPYGRKAENGATLHDLRRTLGSWQAKTGASLAIIGKSLNHKNIQSTMIYARLDLDPVRASVNTATAAMMEAAGLKQPAEVLPIKSNTAA